MKITSILGETETRYHCDICKIILDPNIDSIQSKVLYDSGYVGDRYEDEEKIKCRDLCRKCYNKEQRKMNRLVKIRKLLSKKLEFTLPLFNIKIRIMRIKIKISYKKCREFFCFRNANAQSITLRGNKEKDLYYCDKHYTEAIDSLIGGKCTIREMNEYQNREHNNMIIGIGNKIEDVIKKMLIR